MKFGSIFVFHTDTHVQLIHTGSLERKRIMLWCIPYPNGKFEIILIANARISWIHRGSKQTFGYVLCLTANHLEIANKTYNEQRQQNTHTHTKQEHQSIRWMFYNCYIEYHILFGFLRLRNGCTLYPGQMYPSTKYIACLVFSSKFQFGAPFLFAWTHTV